MFYKDVFLRASRKVEIYHIAAALIVSIGTRRFNLPRIPPFKIDLHGFHFSCILYKVAGSTSL